MKNAYEHWNKKEWRYLGNTPVDVRNYIYVFLYQYFGKFLPIN